jgi:hypothetical protein
MPKQHPITREQMRQALANLIWVEVNEAELRKIMEKAFQKVMDKTFGNRKKAASKSSRSRK